MQPESLMPYLQKPATISYLEADEARVYDYYIYNN